MSAPAVITIDLETLGIQGRPDYPPMILGAGIQWPGEPAHYFSFGHHSGNNCTFEEAKLVLMEVYASGLPILMQNAKFDLDCIEVHMGLPLPVWERIHDTMFLAFLDAPHADSFSLKPLAEKLLGMPPEERDEVGEWFREHQPVPGVRVSTAPGSKNTFMRFLEYCPGDLVGKYCIGDLERTTQLFQLLYPRIVDGGMLEAYDRERRLMPVLLDMERQGVPIDIVRLAEDVRVYTLWYEKVDAWLFAHLKCDSGLNLDSGDQLMDAMIAAGKVDTAKATLTPKSGKYKTSKDALLLAVTDPVLLAVLTYRSQLGTCLQTFMRPWLETAEKTAGSLIFTTWNQVRATHGKDNGGARTGRLSSSPNFQNIAKVFKSPFKDVAAPWPDLPPLPAMRSYIKPFDGEVLIGRDFKSQELRILAHYESDTMLDLYVADPAIDLHQRAADLITQETGVEVDKSKAKMIAFSILYGSGLAHLSETLHCTVEEAKRLKNAYLSMFPGIRDLQDMLKKRAAHNLPFRTFGGRLYHCEPPQIKDGKRQSYEYKMLNVLIQGSAADQTKEAVIRFHGMKTPGQILLLVHDEIVVSVPEIYADVTMDLLQEAMDGIELDCPMLSDGERGMNWGAMESTND